MKPASLACLGLCLLFVLPPATHAQLDQTFDRLFQEFLIFGFQLSPGEHGEHFLPVSEEAARELSPTLNSLIGSNVSSFPLSSTISIEYEFSSGMPVRVLGSLGPIFAESARTLGRGKLYVGFNYTHLGLSRYRGLPTDEFRFTFTHQDVGEPGLGDVIGESDLVDLFLDLQVDANTYLLFATYGVSNRFDVSIALPIVEIQLEGQARGVVQSFTFANAITPQHHFGTEDDFTFEKIVPYHDRAAGLGDMALRLKYQALQDPRLYLALLLDLRMPTGDERNFLGTGKPTPRLAALLSRKIGNGTAHLNLDYEHRPAERDSDEIGLTLSFDQEVLRGLTVVGEFIGTLDINTGEAIELFPGTVEIVDQPGNGLQNTRIIDLSNIPEASHDHTFDLSLGARAAATEQFTLLSNVLVPMNQGGLRSTVTVTLGMSVFF